MTESRTNEPSRPLPDASADTDRAAARSWPLDLPLPLLDGPSVVSPVAAPWARTHPVPTTLVALCPDDEPPTLDAVRATLTALLGEDFIDCGPLERAPGACHWSLVVGLRGSNRRILLWAEMARDLDPEELDDETARQCRFAILLETVLAPGEAIDDLARAMRLLVSLVPDCPALLDLQAHTWHLRESLDREFLVEDADPPDWALWTVTAVSGQGGRGPAWISTCGLGRCGLPELEMLGVPPEQVRTAVAMINDLAGLLLEESPPPPDEPWDVGPDIAVTLRPWRDVAQALPPHVPGSLDSRRMSSAVEATEGPDHPFAGVRAVVCDVHGVVGAPDGDSIADAAAWPADVARRIEAGGVVMYRAQRATAREARLAQRTFGRFATAFAALRRDGIDAEAVDAPAFFVKVGLPLGTHEEDGHEHLWFRLLEVTGAGGCGLLRGRLMHQPAVLEEIHEGDAIELRTEQVSSWQVICDGTLFVPDAADAMADAVDACRGRREATRAEGSR